MNIKRAYKKIFYSEMNISQAIALVKSDVEQTEEVQKIIKFVDDSDRGLI